MLMIFADREMCNPAFWASGTLRFVRASPNNHFQMFLRYWRPTFSKTRNGTRKSRRIRQKNIGKMPSSITQVNYQYLSRTKDYAAACNMKHEPCTNQFTDQCIYLWNNRSIKSGMLLEEPYLEKPGECYPAIGGLRRAAGFGKKQPTPLPWPPNQERNSAN